MSHGKISNTAVYFILVFFCIQDPLQYFFPVFRYVDEFLAVSAAVLFLLRLAGNGYVYPFRINTVISILFLAGFLIAGGISTIFNGVQPFGNVCMDGIVWIKFPCAIGAGYFLAERGDCRQIRQTLILLLDMITLILVLVFAADAVFHIFQSDTRLGFRAVKLFYTTYSALTAVACFLSAVYLRLYEELGEKTILRLIPLWIIMCSTLRTKAICAVFVMMLIYITVCQKRHRISMICWAAIGAGILLIGFRTVMDYFVIAEDETARSALLTTALQIIQDYFPLGTGFASFGSAFSAEPYSRIYELYHINHVWGITKTYHSFISDSFWPYLLGETGILGSVFYTGFLASVFWRVTGLAKWNACAYASALSCLIYLFITSFGESAFANTFAVYFGIWIGILFSEGRQGYEDIGLHRYTLQKTF
ncbi:MAG: hypothetical protein LUF78_06500 [Clostridiales bacterium]|nr:hypothetical protein [Clostridiales bacterium]